VLFDSNTPYSSYLFFKKHGYETSFVMFSLVIFLSIFMASFSSVRKLSMSSIKVTSYNVLSSHLASPTYFLNCKPQFLDSNYRYRKLLTKLEKEIDDKSIICLQEISQSWSALLYPFFVEKGYTFITALYGKKFNGYMGVGIAIPTNKYDLLDVDISRIADTKRLPKKPKLIGLFLILDRLKNFIWKLLKKNTFDLWETVLSRHNQMISVRLKLKDTGKNIVVGWHFKYS
jgi:mRNA deadenylase 3'-5' endonuclease subunit Ccr4